MRRPLEHEHVHCLTASLGPALCVPDVRCLRVVLASPGGRPVDSLAVHLQPTAELLQSLLVDKCQSSVASGAHVDQQVAATTDGRYKCGNKLFYREHVGQGGIPAVAPRALVQGHAVLPLVRLQYAWVITVIAREVAAMMARAALTPAVIRDDLVFDGAVVVKPGQELPALPVLRGGRIAVGPDDLRLVSMHQFVELDESLPLHKVVGGEVVALVEEKQGVEPLEKRVVNTENKVGFGSDGIGQFSY